MIMISLALSWLPIFVLAILGVEAKTSGKVAAAWYAGWHSKGPNAFPLSKVSWSKYTHLTYSFAETTPDVTALTLNGSEPDLLPQFVKQARLHGVKSLVSIGGWAGSRYFSTNVGSEENRTAFVKTVTDFAKKYKLDGLDFDWEYPTSAGIGCNAVNKSDTANFLLFLQELRKDPHGSKLIVTAATNILPFVGSDGKPSSDVSNFAKVLDFVALMVYDIWGSWSPGVGPNAPLNDTCAATKNQVGSAVSAVQKWHDAGIPYDQLVLGVASYGHSFEVNETEAFEPGSKSILAPYPSFNSTAYPKGDAWDNQTKLDVCGNPQPNAGTYTLRGLFQNGFIDENGKPLTGKDISFRFDDCSKTAYVYNLSKKIMVSYSNEASFDAIGKYINVMKLRGFSMWEAGGDLNNILLKAIRKAGGYKDSGHVTDILTCI